MRVATVPSFRSKYMVHIYVYECVYVRRTALVHKHETLLHRGRNTIKRNALCPTGSLYSDTCPRQPDDRPAGLRATDAKGPYLPFIEPLEHARDHALHPPANF